MSTQHEFAGYSERRDIWQRCQALTDDMEWQPDSGSQSYSDTRQLTWAHYPYRYLLSEFGRRKKPLLRREKIYTKLFQISMLSAQSAYTGLRDFRQYFIASNLDQLYLLHNQVGDIDDDRATQDYIDCTNFALDNHFTSPNEQDVLMLEHALHLAEQDGSHVF